MIAYDIKVLPLIRELKYAHSKVSQPWYADNVGVGGTFHHILSHMYDIMLRYPSKGVITGSNQEYLGCL